MAKNDPIEKALDRLGELRHGEASEAVGEELRGYLRHRSNLVVAKAAGVVRDLNAVALTPDLVIAFHRYMADAPRLDKRCAALTEIASTLYEMDYSEPEIFLWGLRHVQLEGSFGPPVDEAAKLRGICAQGLMRTRHRDAAAEVVRLLVDSEPAARLGAVRALGVNGGEAGVLLLQLKVWTGDDDLAVPGECFAALLAARPEKSVAFVAQFADAANGDLAAVAMLALGESRLPTAYAVLKEKWERTATLERKKILLASIAASRLEEAIAFLISLVESANAQTAAAAVEALSIYRYSERVGESLKRAVLGQNEKLVVEAYRRCFGT